MLSTDGKLLSEKLTYYRGSIRILLCLMLMMLICHCSPQRHIIENPDIDDWDVEQKHYKNLFPPQYGYMEESAYDAIDFRQPHEKGTRKYALLRDPRGDIDRTKGYDPAEYTINPDLSLIRQPVHDIQITWIRHASFLIQINGKYQILVDPVLEKIDGIVGTFGKYYAIGRLYAETPLTVEDLSMALPSSPTGNKEGLIVLISHDHYDHLNYNTLEKLPEDTRYYVPHGVEIEFPKKYAHVVGMDWYTTERIGELAITYLPANHRSGRSLTASNGSLWGGWLLEWQGHRIYFAGDTGYSEVFNDIASHVGKMDVCLMPISAWFQRHWHFAPEDAIVAAQDLGCGVFIPWGWGTWIMSFEHMLDPPRRLQYAWDHMQHQEMELRIMKMGETYVSGSALPK
jgi:L-ascorbate metabolism protein UlaG (beta-lactamase superfamily)